MRPSIFLSHEPSPNCITLSTLKDRIKTGHAAKLYSAIQETADHELNLPLYLPTTKASWRRNADAEKGNAEFGIVKHTCSRVQRHALLGLLLQDRKYIDAALEQMYVTFDETKWPLWRDNAHPTYDVDLRTGMFIRDFSIAYDWLSSLIDDSEKQRVLEGFTRRGIEPYLRTIKLDPAPHWFNKPSNWMTCIVGGFGVAGMVLREDHPDSQTLVDLSLPRMRDYLKHYGPNGEFNEAVGYANATRVAVDYFAIRGCYNPDEPSPLAQHPFPQTCYWMLQMTLPPFRLATFGDTPPNTITHPEITCAIAAATQDPVLQWFYHRCHEYSERQRDEGNSPKAEANVFELLSYDASITPQSGNSGLPLSCKFDANDKAILSRSMWEPTEQTRVVYSKAAQEPFHHHHDCGQVCIDAAGEELIVDLGKPDPYPDKFFSHDRYRFYIASTRGHNVLMFDDEEQIDHTGGDNVAFEPTAFGCSWRMDLSNSYEADTRVQRTVLFLHGGVAAVLDEATVAESAKISLRWHPGYEPDCDAAAGAFRVMGEKAHLLGNVVSLDGQAITMSSGNHAYEPPLDKARLGVPMPQKHEPWIAFEAEGVQCRWLSMFAIGLADEPATAWVKSAEDQWDCTVGDARFVLRATGDVVQLVSADGCGFQVDGAGRVLVL